jgi:hypothetical protein
MNHKERTLVIPELEKLPDIPSRQWSQQQEKTLWNYRNKGMYAVSKFIGKSPEACRMKLGQLKKAHDAEEEEK